MRMLVTRLIIMLAVGSLAAASANALDFNADINAGSTVVANGITIDSAGNGTADLSDGDTIAVEVFVSNVPQDVITAIFASLTFDSVELTFLGGAYANILTADTCVGFLCSPATLTPGIPNPILKPNSPLALTTGTEDWVQAVAHTNVAGTDGAGVPPDSAIVLAFSVIGNLGTAPITIGMELTPGDAIGDIGGLSEVTTFDSVTINVPEPGMLAASMASLGTVGLIAAGRRRRNNV